jgi:hypothetical protein
MIVKIDPGIYRGSVTPVGDKMTEVSVSAGLSMWRGSREKEWA